MFYRFIFSEADFNFTDLAAPITLFSFQMFIIFDWFECNCSLHYRFTDRQQPTALKFLNFTLK